jgi:hypothetical protein
MEFVYVLENARVANLSHVSFMVEIYSMPIVDIQQSISK